MSEPVIATNLVALDVDFGATTSDVITNLAGLVAAAGRAGDATVLAADAQAREAKSGTGVPGGVAIPHCRSEAVSVPTLAFARLKNPVDFSGPDGPANLVFLIAAPAGGGKEHLKILSKLARALVKKDFLTQLREAQSPAEIEQAVLAVVNATPANKPAATPAPAATATGEVTRIVAITACPTGIAHTYMAADSLTQTAAEMPGVELVVETQGSSKTEPVAQSIIDAADACIFATDVGVRDKARFNGKPVIESGVKRAINEPRKMIEEAIAAAKNPNARKVDAGSVAASSEGEGEGLGWGKRIQQAVMTGVSYMIPFVAAGGLLLALGFLFGGYQVANVWKEIVNNYNITNLPGHDITVDGEVFNLPTSGILLYLGAIFFGTGNLAMGFVVAALSGYIAYALAGRPGIAPGFVGGAISAMIGAGFLGGLVTGILAGLLAAWIGGWKVPRVIGSLMPVVIIPLLSSLIVGLGMFIVLGRPLAAIMTGLDNWLNSMSGSSAVLVGIIVGLMMCFDLGGPVNKAAYLFATSNLDPANDPASMKVMAAVMAAGMVPPIALSAATFIRKNLFTAAEQENGKSAWLLGLSFISEGAIPFAAADPLRVIPSMMVGGAVTGALSMIFGAASAAPHGGVFVFFAITHFLLWLVAIIVGAAVSTALVIVLKGLGAKKTAAAAK